MIILSIRRVHIKNKIQRKLRKNGLPKRLAKNQANKYKSILVEFGSLKGIWRLSKEFRKKPEDKNNLHESKKVETKAIEHTNNQSSIT